jgi:hypothetical protein
VSTKQLPPEMRDWYFPFDWDLERLWALVAPVEHRTLAELRWHLDLRIWSVARGMHFDLRPAEVLRHPGRYPRHDARIAAADLCHPLDLMFSVDRFAILDGVHRLARYEQLGLSRVRVRIIPREMIPCFAEAGMPPDQDVH